MNGRSAERAARVLELLSAHPGPLPATMISRELVLPRSSTYHLLNVLRSRGFVAYQPDVRAWNIGAKAAELASDSPTLHQAFEILEAFDRASEHLTLEEVSTRTGYSSQMVARALAQLQAEGLVVAVAGVYSLGLRLAALAARIGPVDRLRTVAQPNLVELRDLSHETANLLVRDGDKAVYLDQVESRHALRHAGWAGRRVPLIGSAAGTALRGKAGPQIVRDGVEAGVTAIACSLGPSFMLPAAIGITGPSARLTDNKRIKECCRLVEDTASRIAAALG